MYCNNCVRSHTAAAKSQMLVYLVACTGAKRLQTKPGRWCNGFPTTSFTNGMLSLTNNARSM